MTKHISILIIEPRHTWSDRFQRREPAAFKVETVHDAFAARVFALEDSYDVIVLDLSLGAGHGLCRQLRRDGVRTPILVIAGESMEDEIVECLQAGAADFLGASGTVEELVDRVRVLGKRRTLSTRRERGRELARRTHA